MGLFGDGTSAGSASYQRPASIECERDLRNGRDGRSCLEGEAARDEATEDATMALARLSSVRALYASLVCPTLPGGDLRIDDPRVRGRIGMGADRGTPRELSGAVSSIDIGSAARLCLGCVEGEGFTAVSKLVVELLLGGAGLGKGPLLRTSAVGVGNGTLVREPRAAVVAASLAAKRRLGGGNDGVRCRSSVGRSCTAVAPVTAGEIVE